MGKKSPSILALFDGRAGNDSQTAGIAGALDVEYHRAPVAFKSRFERIFDMGNGAYLTDACKNLLHELPTPDVVISTGSRAAFAARYIARHVAPKVFRVNVMTPHLLAFRPDMCVIPMHDGASIFARGAFYTLGAPNAVAQTVISSDALKDFRRDLCIGDDEKLLGVCIGGAVKDAQPTLHDIKNFVAELSYAVKETGRTPLITYSRRTPDSFRTEMDDAFPDAHYSDDIKTIYAVSDRLCVTGDSVSMCSEACSTGKLVYIGLLPSVMRKKHLSFTERLTTGGYARLLADKAEYEDDFPRRTLTDAADAAKEILRRYGRRG